MYHFVRTLLCVCLPAVFVSLTGYARPPFAAGRVYDSYTRELLDDVQIDVLAKGDSTLIATVFSASGGYAFNMPCNIRLDSVPAQGAIMLLRREGYYQKFADIPAVGPSEWGIELKPLLLDRNRFISLRR